MGIMKKKITKLNIKVRDLINSGDASLEIISKGKAFEVKDFLVTRGHTRFQKPTLSQVREAKKLLKVRKRRFRR